MTPTAIAAMQTVIRRDLRLAARRWTEFALPPLFLLLVASLFPLGLSPTGELLRLIAPGVIWVAALLAALLGLELLFRPDHDDGSLEFLALTPQPLEIVVVGRIVAHWIVTGLPLIVVTPVIAVMYAMPGGVVSTLVIGLALGTPLLSLLGGLAAALTVSLKGGAALLAILVLPLCVPVLIFGARAAAMAADGADAGGPLYLIAAMLVLALTLVPFAIAAALRINME